MLTRLNILKRIRACDLLVGWTLIWLTNAGNPGLAQSEDERPYGIAQRDEWTASRLQGTPDPPPPYTVQRVFPGRKFRNPVFMAQEPGTSRLLVAELEGRILAFDKHDRTGESTEVFLDLGRQIYAFSFHPEYATNGQVFVFCPQSSDKTLSSVARFYTNLTGARRCDPASEEDIIQWPSGGHNGGEAIFGPDGYLYISTGDSTGGSDLKATGQGIDDLLSVIMRIDVDHPSEKRLYTVPADNPFIDVSGARPEIWAFGFRNPWRMSFDDETGRLWVGDVGQDLWEMIWDVRRGGNYGWSVREGSHSFHPHKPSGPGPILPPVIEHPHTICRSITGGYVYRGDRLPELDGAYIYGDYQYGKIWGLRYDGQRVTWHDELADTSLQIPTFAVSRDGEFFVVDHLSGELFELVKAERDAQATLFPHTLSETGLFTDTANHALSAGVVSYSVNTPQWLDGAVAERFFGVPPGTTIHFVEQSGDATTWSLQDGSVLAETISIEQDTGEVMSRRRLETRVLIKQEDHWLGYSYLWNEQQTDADLVPAEGTQFKLQIKDAQGTTQQQTWKVPSRNECMVCHSRAAGFVLGLNTLQINREHDYGECRDNQLRALSHAAYFDEPLQQPAEKYDAMPDAYDDSAALDSRARAYLHVNCSVCHVSDGGGNARFQARYGMPIEDLKLIDEAPIHGNFDLDDARLVAARDPYSSVLFYRLSKTGLGRMPHVGSQTLDIKGLRLLREWIFSLNHAADDSDIQQQVTHTHRDLAEALEQANSPGWIDSQLSTTRQAFIISDLLLDDAALREECATIVSAGVADTRPNVRDLFEKFLPESQRTQTLGERFDPGIVLQRQGNPEQGRAIFFGEGGTQCKSCHRVRGQGGDFGPDLSSIGTKYTRQQLLDTIANPSLRVEPPFLTQVITTHSGQVYSGLIADEDEQQVYMKVYRGDQVEMLPIALDQVEERVSQSTSLMPERLLRDMTPQQAADLVDFLTSLRNPVAEPDTTAK